MTSHAPSYYGYRFPPEIISHAVWLYHRFCLSFRDAEDLLAQRGITVSYEAIRQWCRTFGPAYARTLRRRRGRMGDTWYLDELFVTIQGKRQYLWRAVDQDGDVIDILVQSRRDHRAADGCAWRDRGRSTDQDVARVSTGTAVERPRSHDRDGEGTRAATVEGRRRVTSGKLGSRTPSSGINRSSERAFGLARWQGEGLRPSSRVTSSIR